MKTKIVLFVAVLLSVTAFSQKKWTLKECVDYALENNITIKQNKLTASLAEKDVAISKGNFLPNLNASSSGRFNSGLSQNTSGVLSKTAITLVDLLIYLLAEIFLMDIEI